MFVMTSLKVNMGMIGYHANVVPSLQMADCDMLDVGIKNKAI
jgi:hypothetical protein